MLYLAIIALGIVGIAVGAHGRGRAASTDAAASRVFLITMVWGSCSVGFAATQLYLS